MLVTEALDSTEDVKRERALAGRGGFLLARTLARRQIKLADAFRIVPSLFCLPSHPLRGGKPATLHTWAADALLHCAPNLDAEIATHAPKVIVALGETAFTALTGIEQPMMAARGYVFRDRKDRCWVIPTFDPTWVLMGNAVYSHIMLLDILKAMELAQTGFAYESLNCLMNPTPDVWEAFVEGFLSDPSRPLALDIETPWSKDTDEDELGVDAELVSDPSDFDESYQIHTVSLAYRQGQGPDTDITCSVDWTERYLDGIARMVKAAGGVQ